MNQQELYKRLNNHKKWLFDKRDGKRLNLCNAGLRLANLRGADLCGANLDEANLHNCRLNWAITQEVRNLTVICAQVNTSMGNRFVSYYPSLDIVTAGCWQSSMADFKERVEAVYGEDGSAANPFLYARYQRVIAFLEQEAKADKERNESKPQETDGEES